MKREKMIRKMIFKLILILIVFFCSNSFGVESTIAILDFSNNSLMEKDNYNSLCSGFAEIMITELSNVSSLKVVERQKINQLIQEMQLAQSGVVSEETGVQVGKLLGAKYLVFGSFFIMDKKIRVDTRIVEVETGLTVKAEQVTDKLSKMFDIIQELNKKIIKNLNISITKNEEKILFEGDASTEVIALFSQALEYEEAGDLQRAKEFYIKAFKMDNNFEPVRKRLKDLLLRMQTEKQN